MKISKNGIELIKKFEGCRLKAYKCAAGVWTIGYGHTKGVKAGDTITQKEAEELLINDISNYEAAVNLYHQYNFNQNQFDALTSFAFNVGSIKQLTNNGNRTIYQIAQHIQSYVFANGRKLEGLIKRRKAEYELFVKPISSIKVTRSTTAKTQVSNLQIREKPDVNSKSLGKLKKGSKIEVLDIIKDNLGNTWYKHSKGYSAAVYEGKVYIK